MSSYTDILPINEPDTYSTSSSSSRMTLRTKNSDSGKYAKMVGKRKAPISFLDSISSEILQKLSDQTAKHDFEAQMAEAYKLDKISSSLSKLSPNQYFEDPAISQPDQSAYLVDQSDQSISSFDEPNSKKRKLLELGLKVKQLPLEMDNPLDRHFIFGEYSPEDYEDALNLATEYIQRFAEKHRDWDDEDQNEKSHVLMLTDADQEIIYSSLQSSSYANQNEPSSSSTSSSSSSSSSSSDDISTILRRLTHDCYLVPKSAINLLISDPELRARRHFHPLPINQIFLKTEEEMDPLFSGIPLSLTIEVEIQSNPLFQSS
jgi:hypothetical protein